MPLAMNTAGSAMLRLPAPLRLPPVQLKLLVTVTAPLPSSVPPFSVRLGKVTAGTVLKFSVPELIVTLDNVTAAVVLKFSTPESTIISADTVDPALIFCVPLTFCKTPAPPMLLPLLKSLVLLAKASTSPALPVFHAPVCAPVEFTVRVTGGPASGFRLTAPSLLKAMLALMATLGALTLIVPRDVLAKVLTPGVMLYQIT